MNHRRDDQSSSFSESTAPRHPDERLARWEDLHDAAAALDLAVQPLLHVVGAEPAVVLVGEVEVRQEAGKSWIASALGVAACNAFFSVRYVRLPEMLDELTEDKGEEWLKMKKRYLKCDLLILDDWLLEKVDGKGARELLQIIEGRLRTGSLLICSQFSPAGWHSKLGEGAIADAVIDRIVYRSDVIHIGGDESMRKRIG